MCLGPLKADYRAGRKGILGLDSAFIKGPFTGQVFTAIAIDKNNCVYPITYSIVEAESKSSRLWFIANLGDEIDLAPNLNYTFISDIQTV